MMRNLLTTITVVILMTATQQCNPEHGGGIGTHGGACKPLGATQTRSDGTGWKCEKGDPGDYPFGTWVRIK